MNGIPIQSVKPGMPLEAAGGSYDNHNSKIERWSKLKGKGNGHPYSDKNISEIFYEY